MYRESKTVPRVMDESRNRSAPLILLSRGVNQATRKSCFVGARVGVGEFVADLHIHGAHEYLLVVKTFTLGSLYYSWLLRSLRIRDFVVATRITLLALAALIIVRIDLKLPVNHLLSA